MSEQQNHMPEVQPEVRDENGELVDMTALDAQAETERARLLSQQVAALEARRNEIMATLQGFYAAESEPLSRNRHFDDTFMTSLEEGRSMLHTDMHAPPWGFGPSFGYHSREPDQMGRVDDFYWNSHEFAFERMGEMDFRGNIERNQRRVRRGYGGQELEGVVVIPNPTSRTAILVEDLALEQFVGKVCMVCGDGPRDIEELIENFHPQFYVPYDPTKVTTVCCGENFFCCGICARNWSQECRTNCITCYNMLDNIRTDRETEAARARNRVASAYDQIFHDRPEIPLQGMLSDEFANFSRTARAFMEAPVDENPEESESDENDEGNDENDDENDNAEEEANFQVAVERSLQD